MKKINKVILIKVPDKLIGTHQIFPLFPGGGNIQLHDMIGYKDTKIKEIIVVYETKEKKFTGF